MRLSSLTLLCIFRYNHEMPNIKSNKIEFDTTVKKLCIIKKTYIPKILHNQRSKERVEEWFIFNKYLALVHVI